MVNSNNTGAGFGLWSENQKVEQTAVAAARAFMQQEGWSVKSVEAQNLGYDLHCTRKNKIRRVEVKGIRGTGLDFINTAAEYARAIKDAEFEVFVVRSALSNPQVNRFPPERLTSVFRFAPIAYRASFLGSNGDLS